MGDRANIKIIQPNNLGAIWIYTHNHGFELPNLLQRALEKATPRWGDTEYFNRILIDQLTKDGRDEETGWGISLRMGDNQYPILCVDVRKRLVWVETEDGTPTTIPHTYPEYLALKDASAWRGR
jgi:hypothetical protein